MMEDEEFNSINIIPFVDIMLVLLTIVLTTSTFIKAELLPIQLPGASEKQSESIESLIVEIDREERIYLNSKPVDLNGLKESINSFDKATPVTIRADKNIVLQVFVDVLDTVKNTGFEKVTLQTEVLK
ncbi:biopolymer transport protein ExbD/TolR [Candidatus Scalindua japonica]|uniref:Biopolymer transport protein ExbD/TolR n=1 Tax=Candidatus Scalindua japonica TaxID=1284222 RepID=A0A286U3A5_9BACT|nr:biopolymer transporter ExbD [Candidatus Scalindua japonica]GAX62609.1 biopolymer transport protein ExbD/TolR [Candidatus Scalindua japonica]